MKKILLLFLLVLPVVGQGQIVEEHAIDTFTIQFSDTMSRYIPDSAIIPLWQIGTTTKPFFETGGLPTRAMMTDTIHYYPKGANNWFILKLPPAEQIVDFWHKYQTDSGHAGGTVEFSTDYGATWVNILGSCNTDGRSDEGVRTYHFYNKSDSLSGGTPGFMGASDTVVYSRFEFLIPPPDIPTGRCFFGLDTIYVRFRFVSDSTDDTLAGWRIDSLKIENDGIPGGIGAVAKISNYQLLQVFPNPTSDFMFQFPALENQSTYTVAVFDAMGVKIIDMPYSQYLNIAGRQPGVYFYKVTNGTNYYSGQLVVE